MGVADWALPIVIRIVTWLFHKSSIPGLDVIPNPGKATIGGRPFDAVYFEFRNSTQSVVVIHRARLRENQKNFPAVGEQDISEGGRILKFKDNGNYTLREITVQPNSSAETLICLSKPLDDSFDSYPPKLWRKWFLKPKYFALQYEATVGRKRDSIEFVR